MKITLKHFILFLTITSISIWGVKKFILKQFAGNPYIYHPSPEARKANALMCLESGKSAVTYKPCTGRFGDNLIAYLHAKWISYKYNIPLLYHPFIYSSQMVLDDVELLSEEKFYKNMKFAVLGKDTTKIDPDGGTIYAVPFFPESLQEFESIDHGFLYFHINWDDEAFLAQIRKLICPRLQLKLLPIPCDKISVAVHVRRDGNGFDKPKTVKRYPFKCCIRDDFYIDGIKKIRTLYKGQPLYVYIFTDDSNPKEIAEKYQQILKDPSITIDYRHDDNNHEFKTPRLKSRGIVPTQEQPLSKHAQQPSKEAFPTAHPECFA